MSPTKPTPPPTRSATPAPSPPAGQRDASASLPLRLAARAQSWLMVEGSPWPLALFRIGLALSVLFEATQNLKRVNYYTPKTFHLPYFDFIVPLPAEQIQQLFEWQYVFAVGLLVGFMTPLSALGVIVTQGYPFLVCQLNFRNHIYMTLLMLTLVMLSPAWRTLSVDALLRWLYHGLVKGDWASGRPPRWVSVVTQRVICLQVVAVYLFATIHKLNPGFLTGYPMVKTLSKTIPRSWLGTSVLTPEQAQWLSEQVLLPQWGALLAYLTVFTEGFLALGLLWGPTRLAAALFGVGLHVSIGASMNIVTFGSILVFAYICFWMPRSRPIMVYKGSQEQPQGE